MVLKPFDLLENVLIDIEKGIRTGINSDILAEKYELSERHLRRLFRFAFNQPVSGYMRSRKLMARLERGEDFLYFYFLSIMEINNVYRRKCA